jgi:hypothetical protein
MLRWFSLQWWEYLLSNLGDKPVNRLVCRIKGHPCGPIYYTMTGFEPDMRCKNCGDEL